MVSAAFFRIVTCFASAALTSASASPRQPVLTPRGYRDTADVHLVPHGGRISHVGKEIHVAHANGTIIEIVPAPTSPTTSAASRGPAGSVPLETGWLSDAYWINPNPAGALPIKWFSTDFVVPPPPVMVSEQTLFLFPGLLPLDGSSILQPVLQYGVSAVGGSTFWGVALWYVIGDQTIFVTPLRSVSSGTNLQGILSLLNFTTSTGAPTYTYWTTMLPGANSPAGLTIDVPFEFTWSTVTLEAYNVISLESYPPGSTTFRNISLQMEDGSVPKPPQQTWSVQNDWMDGFQTTVEVDSFSEGAVVIDYPISESS
ncbi:hypothetical protein HMN09_00267700 [Mycena chlorophos]|uniref:Uncharacterized protein n=1 Tax=Mycena chlorophos TaxID=658473 RepID=A0A8H6TM94_MYCCL|nr:hypothetical protein HMN09_00267700 [Mycena chlorophos]